jgi:hypothetical protein
VTLHLILVGPSGLATFMEGHMCEFDVGRLLHKDDIGHYFKHWSRAI